MKNRWLGWGKTIEQLTPHLSEDTSVYDNEVQIYTDNYQLLLFFNYDNTDLYEAKLKIH